MVRQPGLYHGQEGEENGTKETKSKVRLCSIASHFPEFHIFITFDYPESRYCFAQV